MQVTEEHVRRMLRITGLDDDSIKAVLSRLTFPADLDDVVVALSPLGVSTDVLIDRMGGSP